MKRVAEIFADQCTNYKPHKFDVRLGEAAGGKAGVVVIFGLIFRRKIILLSRAITPPIYTRWHKSSR